VSVLGRLPPFPASVSAPDFPIWNTTPKNVSTTDQNLLVSYVVDGLKLSLYNNGYALDFVQSGSCQSAAGARRRYPGRIDLAEPKSWPTLHPQRGMFPSPGWLAMAPPSGLRLCPQLLRRHSLRVADTGVVRMPGIQSSAYALICVPCSESWTLLEPPPSTVTAWPGRSSGYRCGWCQDGRGLPAVFHIDFRLYRGTFAARRRGRHSSVSAAR
jgi:hypothetical protein